MHPNAIFIAALFTIVKTWKQPKRLLAEEWIKQMWYIYTVGCWPQKKKKKPFVATQMNLEIAILSEVPERSQRKTNT